MRYNSSKIKKSLYAKDSAVSSVISIMLVLMMFFSVAGGVLIWGPQMMSEMQTDTQNTVVSQHFSVLDDALDSLMQKGDDSTGSGQVAINEGSLSIDSEGDNLVISYMYDSAYDITPTGLSDGDEKFSLEGNGDNDKIDTADIYWLKETCFLAGTQVLMSDGSYKNIEDVKVGDIVLSFDEKSKDLSKSVVKEVFVHQAEEMPEFYLIINGELKVTPNHKFYSQGKWVYAGELSVGDKLFSSELKDYEISSLDRIYNKVESFDLDVEYNDNFFVNVNGEDILAHNDDGYPWPVEIEELLLSDTDPDYRGYENWEVECRSWPGIPGPWDITETFGGSQISDDVDPSTHFIRDLFSASTSSPGGVVCPGETPDIGVQQNYRFRIAPEDFTIYGDELVEMNLLWNGVVSARQSVGYHINPTIRQLLVKTDSGTESMGDPDYVPEGGMIDAEEGWDNVTMNVTSNFLDYIDDDNWLYISCYVGLHSNYQDRSKASIRCDKVAVQYVNALPNCSLSANRTSGATPFNVTFSMSASDPTGQIAEWELDTGEEIDGGPGGGMGGSATIKYSGTGEPPATLEHEYTNGYGWKTATLTVWDTLGAEASDSVAINLGTEPTGDPPSATLTPNPSSGNAALTVDFAIHAEDTGDNAGIVSWKLVSGDTENPTVYSDSGSFGTSYDTSQSHTYNSEGTYYAILSVTDRDGRTYTHPNVEISVIDGNVAPDPPSSFSWNSNDHFYNEIDYDFTVEAIDQNGDDLLYKFDWGDGSYSDWSDNPATTDPVTLTHSWTYQGVCEVRVKAKDTSGLESKWSDPVPVNVDYKFIAPEDEDRSLLGQSIPTNPGTDEVDLGSGNELTGSVAIYLFDDEYPAPGDPAAGQVAVGIILVFDLGHVEYSAKTANSVEKTILESGSIITDSATGAVMQSCSNIYEDSSSDLNTLGINIKKIRGIDSTSGAGGGIYELEFKKFNTVIREEQVHTIYNIKLQFTGDYADAWKDYLIDNTKFLAESGNPDVLVYNHGGNPTHMILSTSVMKTSLRDIN